jgi:hypothetical protein
LNAQPIISVNDLGLATLFFLKHVEQIHGGALLIPFVAGHSVCDVWVFGIKRVPGRLGPAISPSGAGHASGIGRAAF